MKRYLASITALAAGVLLLSQPLAAQDKQDKEKDEKTEKSKLNDNEEIIIKKKGDKDSKVTIEIKDGEVMVNGKPLDEFDDDNVVIQKGRGLIYTPRSPFRGQSGTLTYRNNYNYNNNNNAPFLGVVTEKTEKGVKVEEVNEGSGAEKAGLKQGDVITKIDDDAITNPDVLTKVIHKHKPDDKITIYYEREGKADKTTATLGKRNYGTSYHFDMPEMPEMPAMPDINFNWDDNGMGRNRDMVIVTGRPRLGIKAQDTEDGKGVKVLDVNGESAAEKAGVKEGDIITEFDGKKVNNADELAAAAREAKEKPSVKITFTRDGKSQTVELKTPRKLRTANL